MQLTFTTFTILSWWWQYAFLLRAIRFIRRRGWRCGRMEGTRFGRLNGTVFGIVLIEYVTDIAE